MQLYLHDGFLLEKLIFFYDNSCFLLGFFFVYILCFLESASEGQFPLVLGHLRLILFLVQVHCYHIEQNTHYLEWRSFCQEAGWFPTEYELWNWLESRVFYHCDSSSSLSSPSSACTFDLEVDAKVLLLL